MKHVHIIPIHAKNARKLIYTENDLYNGSSNTSVICDLLLKKYLIT